MAKSPKKPAAAFFDIDNTLVRGSTSYQFGKAAYKRKFFPRKDFIAFAWHQVVFLTKGETTHMLSAIKDRALGLVVGREYAQMMALVSDVYASNIKPNPLQKRMRSTVVAASLNPGVSNKRRSLRSCTPAEERARHIKKMDSASAANRYHCH